MSLTTIDHKQPLSIESQFHAAALDAFQNFNFANATFLAERLRYTVDNEQNRCLLAECYLAENKYYNVFEALEKAKSPRAKYLFAIACFKMGKLKEAEEALLSQDSGPSKNMTKNYDSVINGAHGLFLLAQVYEKNQNKAAADCYFKAYVKNPLNVAALERFLLLSQSLDKLLIDKLIKAMDDGLKKPQEIELQMQLLSLNLDKKAKQEKVLEPRDFVKQRLFKAESDKLSESGEFRGGVKGSSKKLPFAHHMMLEDSNSKNRLQGSSKKSPKSKKPKSEFMGFFTKQKVESKAMVSPIHASKFCNNISDYFITIIKPYIKLMVQEPQLAIEMFTVTNSNFENDPWILNNMGKCYTELSNHKKAETCFSKAHAIDKARIEGKEYYSSCLWHLKKQSELSKLAFDYMKNHYFAPETWIIMANCYSLNQDHDTALTFLGRAIQIDPQNAYAYCLSGHEYSCKENFDKAKECYEKAINLDQRNVRAYWGLGNLNLKTEKYDIAADYFLTAIRINDNCCFFYTHLAIAFMRKGKYQDALEYVRFGEKVSPTDAFNRFTKAQILYELGDYDGSLFECDSLLKTIQKEAQVHILMGKIYAKKAMVQKAHNSYTIANDLDKKNTQQIKNLIDQLQEPTKRQLNW